MHARAQDAEHLKLAGKFSPVLFLCQSLRTYKMLNQWVCGRHVLVIRDTSLWLTSSFRDDAMLSHGKCRSQIFTLGCLIDENQKHYHSA